MTSLYTNEIRQFIRSRDWPIGLRWKVTELDDPAPYLLFWLYRDNINALGGEDKMQLAKVLNETLSSIHKSGVPIYTKVAKGNGIGD